MKALAIVALSGLLTACAAPESGQQPDGSKSGPRASEPDPARKEVLAPIESADVLVRESAPPQYALRIVSGLPSGCARFSRIAVERRDAQIDVTVWNTVPADAGIACTMIYGTAENTAELGSDFRSGQTYEVRVNGERKASFTAQ